MNIPESEGISRHRPSQSQPTPFPASSPIERLRCRIPELRRPPDSTDEGKAHWTIRSPLRIDERPSVSITETEDETVLIYDHGDSRCGSLREDQVSFVQEFLAHYSLTVSDLFGRGRGARQSDCSSGAKTSESAPDHVSDAVVEAFTHYMALEPSPIGENYVSFLPRCLMSLEGMTRQEEIHDRNCVGLKYRFTFEATVDLDVNFDHYYRNMSCGGPYWPADWLHEGAWTYPERDGDGRIVGAGVRLIGQPRISGTPSKLAVVLIPQVHRVRELMHGKRGLIIPQSLLTPTPELAANQPLLVPEGLSDVLALTSVGQCAIGRPCMQPSRNTTGWLAHYIERTGWRRIIIVGERDQDSLNNDSMTRSKQAARELAQRLVARLGRPIEVMIPALGCKDVREQIAHGYCSLGLSEHSTFYPTNQR